jgi:hypothetical protein
MKDFIEIEIFGDIDRDLATELIEENSKRLIEAIESRQGECSEVVSFSYRTERGSFVGTAGTADFARECGVQLRNAEVTLYVTVIAVGDLPTKPSRKPIRKKQQLTQDFKILLPILQQCLENMAHLWDRRLSESANNGQNLETVQRERSSAFVILSNPFERLNVLEAANPSIRHPVPDSADAHTCNGELITKC